MAGEVFAAIGRRKTSVASVRLRPGTGQFLVNGHPLKEYLGRETSVMVVLQPLEMLGLLGKLDILCKAKGGGLSGQAGAIRLGVARALQQMDPTVRGKLKDAGFLTRDPRMVERKKYGRVKARKRYQYSKR